jgi:hypothetical protein
MAPGMERLFSRTQAAQAVVATPTPAPQGVRTLFRPTHTGNVSSGGPEAWVPRPNPILPLGGPFRRWHLTPWKSTEATALLDDLEGNQLGDEYDDADASGGLGPASYYLPPTTTSYQAPSSGFMGPVYTPAEAPATGGGDWISGLLGQVGQLVGLKSGAIVNNPRPGQLVNQATAANLQSNQTMTYLTLGGLALAALLIMRKK